MDYAYTKRRSIIGSEEIPEGCELITTTTYAKRFFLAVRTVRYQCKCGKLKAYKVAGKWHILTPVV